jgi:hypothetical protein
MRHPHSRHDLERDCFVELAIVDAANGTHAAPPEQAEHLIAIAMSSSVAVPPLSIGRSYTVRRTFPR